MSYARPVRQDVCCVQNALPCREEQTNSTPARLLDPGVKGAGVRIGHGAQVLLVSLLDHSSRSLLKLIAMSLNRWEHLWRCAVYLTLKRSFAEQLVA